MKRLLLAVAILPMLLVALSLQTGAQPSQEELQQLRDQKLEAKFFKNASWIVDYDEARRVAKESNKLIFAYFTRSFAP